MVFVFTIELSLCYFTLIGSGLLLWMGSGGDNPPPPEKWSAIDRLWSGALVSIAWGMLLYPFTVLTCLPYVIYRYIHRQKIKFYLLLPLFYLSILLAVLLLIVFLAMLFVVIPVAAEYYFA
jgi:hypothetical protein